MKILTRYERLNPDTFNGESIRVSVTYSSFDKSVIDKLEESFKNDIGTGLLSEVNDNINGK